MSDTDRDQDRWSCRGDGSVCPWGSVLAKYKERRDLSQGNTSASSYADVFLDIKPSPNQNGQKPRLPVASAKCLEQVSPVTVRNPSSFLGPTTIFSLHRCDGNAPAERTKLETHCTRGDQDNEAVPLRADMNAVNVAARYDALGQSESSMTLFLHIRAPASSSFVRFLTDPR